ncbi:hypothetical protein HSX37_09035|uniref:YjcQ protein n=1 Tax=Dendrosporobacter quercicolus TaxID=146817 RepID=A0A1G9Q9Z9_9FIRM|nr:hypothetical protein [Dendrosporobacter quercicolus]NSL48171.1 hypothetical protein [Dendrosporobacter quercicolus DSM 1736]SDM07912.1 YjcQ protein [Dendrosporobacter quercicolus]
MRSELLLKLTGKYNEQDKEHFKQVELTGPHDYVLIELYKEQRQANPDMSRVTPELVQLEEKLFMLAVKKLQNQGLISGAVLESDENGMPYAVDLTGVKLTPAGVAYERHLG